MPGDNYLDDLVAFVGKTVKSCRTAANWAMCQFIIVRLGLVVVAALLPYLTTLDDKTFASVAAIIVAILTGFDTQFQWGEEWRQYRSTERALERLQREFELRQHSLKEGPLGNIDTDLKNVQKFSGDVEELLREHNSAFFKFRITPPGKNV